MNRTTSSRRRRWFFARAMARAYRDLLEKRRQKRKAAPSRPLFAEALEPRVLFSGTPVPADVEQDQAQAQEQADMAQTAEMLETAADEQIETGVGGVQSIIIESEEELEFDEKDIERLAQEAIARWEEAGLTDEQLEALENLSYTVTDLEGLVIGAAEGDGIFIDVDAAGAEWFVDDTEWLDEEFVEIDGILRAAEGADIDGLAEEGIDLLSAIMHEQGHALGLLDLDDGQWGDVMFSHIGEGMRRLAYEGQAEGAIAGSLEGIHYLTATDDSYDTLSTEVLSVSAAGGLLANDDVGSGATVTTDGLTLNYNANDPNNVTGGVAPFTWTPNSGNAGDDFVLNANITYDAITGDRAGITNSFTFSNGGSTNRGINDLSGDPSDNSTPTPVTFAETPQIGAAKAVTAGPVNNGDGTYSLTYTVT
ncbi:MAG: LEPR-XLL domain-containing protein, partial [Verrucomicrobiota bacterium]